MFNTMTWPRTTVYLLPDWLQSWLNPNLWAKNIKTSRKVNPRLWVMSTECFLKETIFCIKGRIFEIWFIQALLFCHSLWVCDSTFKAMIISVYWRWDICCINIFSLLSKYPFIGDYSFILPSHVHCPSSSSLLYNRICFTRLAWIVLLTV